MSLHKETNCPNCGAVISGSICEYCGTIFPANIDKFAGKPSLFISFDDNGNMYIQGMYVTSIRKSLPELYFSTNPDEVRMFRGSMDLDINISGRQCDRDVLNELLTNLKEKL